MAAKSTKVDWRQMDALHAERGLSANDPGFTIYEYCERYGITRDGAHGRLDKLVRSGRLTTGWRQVNSRRMKVYRFPE